MRTSNLNFGTSTRERVLWQNALKGDPYMIKEILQPLAAIRPANWEHLTHLEANCHCPACKAQITLLAFVNSIELSETECIKAAEQNVYSCSECGTALFFKESGTGRLYIHKHSMAI